MNRQIFLQLLHSIHSPKIRSTATVTEATATAARTFRIADMRLLRIGQITIILGSISAKAVGHAEWIFERVFGFRQTIGDVRWSFYLFNHFALVTFTSRIFLCAARFLRRLNFFRCACRFDEQFFLHICFWFPLSRFPSEQYCRSEIK